MEPEFILRFKGRRVSETYEQNFLWKFYSAYIMDNHRAALWCWLQHINLKRYASSINDCIFATHGKGDPPRWNNRIEIPDFQLVSYVSHSLGEGEWIINVDLDYFFYENYENKYGRLYSDEYTDELFQEIAKWYKAGRIAVITLCISPETCGGWESAEILASRVCRILELPFSLP